MKKTKGFTLTELLVVVTIIGVLASVAYPSYTKSLIKGNRAQAKSLLLDVAQKQQQYLLDNRAYFDDADVNTVMGTLPPEFTKFYTLTVDPINTDKPPTFTATATPIPGTRQDGDGALTIDQTGAKSPADKW